MTILLATIRAAKSGDHRAFEDLVRATERRVANLSWRILGDGEEVKEAVQETFLRLFRHLKRYDETRDFHGWLARITINVCRDLDRRRKRRGIFAPLDDALAHASGERVDDAAAARSDAALVGRAIETLPERERLAIILRDVEGLSTEEVAQLLGNKAATVRVQLSKARAKVREWLLSRRRAVAAALVIVLCAPWWLRTEKLAFPTAPPPLRRPEAPLWSAAAEAAALKAVADAPALQRKHRRPVPKPRTETTPMRIELATADPDVRIIWISR